MKKAIWLVVIVLLIIGGFYLYQSGRSSTEIETNSSATGHPSLSNAVFQFDDGPITLKNGTAEHSVAPGSSLTSELTLSNNIAYGDLNGDEKEDAAGLLIDTNSFSNTFTVYLVAYISGNIRYKGTNAVALGTMITPKSISISNGTITVKYLDRNQDEPLSVEPTVLVTKTFAYQNGQIVEK